MLNGAMSYLQANLTALASVIGFTPVLPDEDGRILVERAPKGPVLYLVGAAGKSVTLNSRRDPLAEACRLLDDGLGGRPLPPVLVLLGLGLGYVVDVVEERSPGTRIVAIEPEPSCVRPLLERRDFTALFASKRLLLLWGPDYRGSAEGWRFFEALDQSQVTIVHPVLSRESPAAFTAAANILGDAACRDVELDAAWLSE